MSDFLRKLLFSVLLLCIATGQANAIDSASSSASVNASTSASSIAAVTCSKSIKLDQPVSLYLNQPFQIPVLDACNELIKDQLNTVELRINGVLTQLKPQACDPYLDINKLCFSLAQQDGNFAVAQREALMGSPWRDLKYSFHRNLPFSVSFNSSTADKVVITGTFHYQILKPTNIIFGFGFIIAVAYALLRLGRESGMLRDVGPEAIPKRSYSLARAQMAWWFFIVLASYVWLWIVQEGFPDISAQALGLMGIGSATYLTAAGVDSSKGSQFGESSNNFFDDILTDSQGIALYRFQLVVFNILFGVLFFVYVIQHVSMPDFDGSILTLLGMSSGTYAGFKIPEKVPKPSGDDADKASTIITDPVIVSGNNAANVNTSPGTAT